MSSIGQVAPERAVAIILVDRGGALLLQLRDGNTLFAPNQWATIAGSLDNDEDPERGARRELREEAGLEVDGPLTLVFHDVWPASYGPGTTEWHVYAAATSATSSDIIVGEGRAITFIDPEAIPDLDLGVSAARILPTFLLSECYSRLCHRA